MSHRILCLAGGSGAGKSTLAEGLVARLGDQASLLGLDDYQKSSFEVPRAPSGRPNYDHPDAVDWPRFLRDLAALRGGADIQVRQKRKCLDMNGGVLPAQVVTVPARPLIIVEGYLALWHPGARAVYDLSIFLDGSPALRLARRRWAKDQAYVDEILLPMHDAYVEPTKVHANVVIDVAGLGKDEILAMTLRALTDKGLI